MRAMLVLALLSGLFGCGRPHFDLRHPIYLVADDSFWNGCGDDPAGYTSCQQGRIETVYHGIGIWTKHFSEPTRPKVLLVYPAANVPADAVNEPIFLMIDEGSGCDGKKWVACYQWGPARTTSIVFRHQTGISPLIVAHEFGHAIWMGDHIHDRVSIMEPMITFYVTPLDVSEMCAVNGACPSHEDTWCEGTFYDEWRCPSASPEEGEHKALCALAAEGIGNPIADCN